MQAPRSTVAFDVQGTLRGGGEKVHKLFKWFESKGCHMVIWSSVYSMALDARREFGYNAVVMSKSFKSFMDDDPSGYEIEVAIDDADFIVRDGVPEPTVTANRVIPVQDIPDDESQFDELFGNLLAPEV